MVGKSPKPRDPNWREREATRQQSRKPLVWAKEPWWYDNVGLWANHFPHVAESDPTKVAYTESADKGQRDIQTIVKPGRYLRRYFSAVLDDAQIKMYADWQSTGHLVTPYSKLPLCFARTPDEIEEVYTSEDGPESCMSQEADEYQSPCHPVRVYGAGDLAIAYLQDDERVIARVLCWPERKVFGRIYSLSNLAERALQAALQAEGYQPEYAHPQRFEGARLLKIQAEDYCYVMPYLDLRYWVEESPDYFIMSRNGQYSSQMQNGLLEVEDPRERCDNCGALVDESSTTEVHRAYNGRYGSHDNPRTWCEDCADQYAFRCEATDERVDSGSICSVQLVDGRRVSEAWAEHHCTRSDISGRWVDPERTPFVTLEDGVSCAEGEQELPVHIEDWRQRSLRLAA